MANWLAFRVGAAPVAICHFIAKSITRSYGVAPRAIIPNGIPVARFSQPLQSRSEWRRANAIPEDAMVFTCVARLAAPKNITVLLEAFAALNRREDILVLAGDGPHRAQLEDEARSRGLAGSVRFLGTRLDVPELLGASDAFVLPSSWEGHPLSVMEAMAAGRAVVATNVGGVPELVSHDETGLLVASEDVVGLASAMRSIAEHEELRERLGRDAGRFASKELDVSLMATRYDALYRDLVAQVRPVELA
jgi:glycosyltransferase involved in cell wall biosynthesis